MEQGRRNTRHHNQKEYQEIRMRRNKLQNKLSKKHFNINGKPIYKSKTTDRMSIYKLEQREKLLKSVIFIQSCVRRWRAQIRIYKIQNKIPIGNKYIDNIIYATMKIYKCSMRESIDKNKDFITKYMS